MHAIYFLHRVQTENEETPDSISIRIICVFLCSWYFWFEANCISLLVSCVQCYSFEQTSPQLNRRRESGLQEWHINTTGLCDRHTRTVFFLLFFVFWIFWVIYLVNNNNNVRLETSRAQESWIDQNIFRFDWNCFNAQNTFVFSGS